MSQVTVTGKIGPGVTVTTVVFSNVTSFAINTDNEILSIIQTDKRTDIDITAATTITITVSGNNYTVSIS